MPDLVVYSSPITNSAIPESPPRILALVGFPFLGNEVITFNGWPRPNMRPVRREYFDLGIVCGVSLRVALGANLDADFNPATTLDEDIGGHDTVGK